MVIGVWLWGVCLAWTVKMLVLFSPVLTSLCLAHINILFFCATLKLWGNDFIVLLGDIFLLTVLKIEKKGLKISCSFSPKHCYCCFSIIHSCIELWLPWKPWLLRWGICSYLVALSEGWQHVSWGLISTESSPELGRGTFSCYHIFCFGRLTRKFVFKACLGEKRATSLYFWMLKVLEAVVAQRKANERKQLFLTLHFYGIGFCFSEGFCLFFFLTLRSSAFLSVPLAHPFFNALTH